MLVSEKQLKKETNLVGEPNSSEIENESKKSSISDTPLLKSLTDGNVLGASLNQEKRKEMISAKGFEPAEFAYERAIGKNDSLYSNFTELIALTKRKIGRIVIKEEGKKMGYATGFMVSDTLLLTNWHVFKDAAMAQDSEVHFFYEYDAQGRPLPPVVFSFDTTFFFNDKDLDYCFLAVRPKDITGTVDLKSIGYLFLDKTLGKVGSAGEERLNIIHHPQGDYKQISIRENLFVGIDNTKIYYQTDTAQGSSGSPVFNDQWQVVGLHHKSNAKMDSANKNYLDKNNQVIPIIDGKIDVTRIVWLKNEGMRISVVLNHLLEKNKGSEVLKGLAIAPPEENLKFSAHPSSQSPIHNTEENNTRMIPNEKNILITVPVSALTTENTIDISLSSKKLSAAVSASDSTQTNLKQDELLLEVSKIEKETNVDFSKCQGYVPDFLGTSIKLPQPKKSIEKQIARLKDKSIELKYFRYSVIFSAFRKMPLISAINVEGDASKRKDNSKRKDDWLRDSRIDIECQLTDKFYSKSGFDRGHMGRFEDANWDTTEEKALRNGIYTCFYTNACPQVPGINREGENLWGKLEKAILEKGVKKQTGKQGRMSVFNGPIFDEEMDRVRLGVTVPMQFYKIVLWLNDADKLRATGFKLSQETLVTDDQFNEAVMLGEEAIDIDKLVAYKEYRCSIKKLGSLTKIDFSHIEKYDTYPSNGGSDETALDGDESLIL